MNILNIGAGKILPLEDCIEKGDHFIVNLDLSYINHVSVEGVESLHSSFNDPDKTRPYINGPFYCNHDCFDFLERYKYKFDHIAMYRFLEHIPKTQVLYFLYILSTSIKIGGTIDVIVPDYYKLAQRILEEDVNGRNFEAEDIITTFELLNEPACPHASIWTIDRAIHFFELEGRFKTHDFKKNFEFDGRDIYLRFFATRVK